MYSNLMLASWKIRAYETEMCWHVAWLFNHGSGCFSWNFNWYLPEHASYLVERCFIVTAVRTSKLTTNPLLALFPGFIKAPTFCRIKTFFNIVVIDDWKYSENCSGIFQYTLPKFSEIGSYFLLRTNIAEERNKYHSRIDWCLHQETNDLKRPNKCSSKLSKGDRESAVGKMLDDGMHD